MCFVLISSLYYLNVVLKMLGHSHFVLDLGLHEGPHFNQQGSSKQL